MSGVRMQLRQMVAVLKRDILMSWSYRVQFVTGLFSGFMSLAIFYYVSRLVRVSEFSPGDYFAFVTVGIITLIVVNAALQIPQTSLRQELVAGTFERILLAPSGTIGAIISLMLFPILYSLITVTVIVITGAALFHLDLQWSTLPLAIPVVLLSLLAFAPFGMLLLASVLVIKRPPPGASYLVVGVSLIAGLYFPIYLLPDWIEWTSEVQPLTPAVELLRSTLVGRSLSDPAWLAVLKLTLFAVAATPLAVVILKRGLAVGRRRGTILEY